MPLAIIATLVAGALAPVLIARVPRHAGWLLAIVPAAITAWLLSQIGRVSEGQPLREVISWVPSIGITASLRLDGLALLFALLISGVGAVVVAYAAPYLAGDRRLGRFYVVLFAFMASMLLIVLADNLLLLYAGWALTGITSFMLIGYDGRSATARRAALQALLTTFAGELCLLAGVILLADAGGSFEISVLLERADRIGQHPSFTPALVLIVIGALTKSAQFPFHYWLPNAMVAPTPVSAYLHSATMVKAGIYLLARLSPIFAGDDVWVWLVGGSGGLTMLIAAVVALHQVDMKRLLAYSNVAALGIMTFLLGVGSEEAVVAVAVFVLGHALYKGALFLVAGIVEHEAGGRDITRLAGLRRRMPRTAIAAGLAALSMAGLLPMFGFIGKELVFEAALTSEANAPLAVGMVLVPNVVFVVVAALVGLRPFFSAPTDTPKRAHDPGLGMLAGPLLMGAAGVLLGLVPGLLASGLATGAVASIRGETAELDLALWHGLTPMLALSAITLAAGALLAWRIGATARAARWLDIGTGFGPERVYRGAITATGAGAGWLSGVMQSGLLRRYLLVTLVSGIGLVGFSFVGLGALPQFTAEVDVRPHEVAIVAVIAAAAFVAISARSRLSAIAALGVVGYGVALIYLLFGAPDLAMTQLLIETLTVIIFVLVLFHLPRFAILSSQRTRLRDGVVAAAAGVLMTGLTLAAFSVPHGDGIGEFFAERSLPDGHGSNVVNVILVDFRAFDTMGEITVLSVAALGIYALIRLRPRKGVE
jgi:multicomponent Na+:H+ antiporter subunit A